MDGFTFIGLTNPTLFAESLRRAEPRLECNKVAGEPRPCLGRDAERPLLSAASSLISHRSEQTKRSSLHDQKHRSFLH